MGKKLKLEELKVESFVTSLKDEQQETVKGGTSPACYATVTFVVTIIESIHEIGDEASWWHCGGGGGQPSDVVGPDGSGGEACILDEVIVTPT